MSYSKGATLMSGSDLDQQLSLVSELPLSMETVGFLLDKQAQGLSGGTIRLYRVELGYFL